MLLAICTWPRRLKKIERYTLAEGTHFIWPPGAGSATGIVFWGALLDPDTGELFGVVDSVSFGFQ
jgi:hypothetical protein